MSQKPSPGCSDRPEYVPPHALRLNDARTGSGGAIDCSPVGSGNASGACATGNSAADQCTSNGSFAGTGCRNGDSAVTDCNTGISGVR